MKGYSRFITYTLKPSTKLQYRTDSEGTSYVWPAGRLESDNYDKVTIERNGRCSCDLRVKWNSLCKHEYRLEGKLVVDKFARRWYNRTYFESNVLPSLSVSPTSTGEQHTITNVQSVIRDDGWHDVGVDQNRYSGNNQINGTDNGDPDDHGCNTNDDEEGETDQANFAPLTYQSVKANCDEMCRYVQNDQLQLAELKLLTDRILSRLRNRQNIHASFVEDVPLSQVDPNLLPKSAVGKIVSNAGSMKRKRSRQEHFHMNRAKKAQPSIAVVTPSNLNGNQDHHLPLPKLDLRAWRRVNP
jgi:hypothetical protein